MDDVTRRAMRLTEMMNERIRSMSPAERDRLTQQLLAAAQTPPQRLRTLAAMMNFAIGLTRMRRKKTNG